MGAGDSALSAPDQGAQASQEPSEGVPVTKDQDNKQENDMSVGDKGLVGPDQGVQASQEDQDTKDNLESSNPTEVCESFEDMKLKDELLKGIFAYGFEKPSSIQQRVIIPCINGHDTVAQVPSGTGKTATFCISALQRVNIEDPQCQVLILAPTKELAHQTLKMLNDLGDNMKIQSHACVEGTAVSKDIQILQRGVQIVVGTPGYVSNMIDRNALYLEELQMFVLDEADKILSLGFQVQIYDIFRKLPSKVQICLFSAMMPVEVGNLMKRFMRNPVRILVEKEALTLEGLRQYFVSVSDEEWKLDSLCDLYETLRIPQATIYCNTRQKTEWLQEKMTSRGLTVSCVHGEMDMSKRQQIMKEFKSGSSRVLITTELLERGIDTKRMSIVINFDLPNAENYLHRVGVSDRFGRTGAAISLITVDESRLLRDIELFYKIKIDEIPNDPSELV